MNKISVIVPIYNVEEYLNKCIYSIINQSYTNLEIILVNDGSTDNSLSICREYEKLDDRIVVIDKKNGGLSSARNSGLDMATGEYISFIDSDDWIHKDFYKILYNSVERNHADISICDLVETTTEDIEDEKYYETKENIFCDGKSVENLYNDMLVQTVVAWNKLFKVDLIKKYRFPEGRIHEDEFLIPKILLKANKVVYISNKLYYYRQRANSIMSQNFVKKDMDKLQALYEQVGIMLSYNDVILLNNSIKRFFDHSIHYYYKYSDNNEFRNKIEYLYRDVYKKRSKSQITKFNEIKYYMFINMNKMFGILRRLKCCLS